MPGRLIYSAQIALDSIATASPMTVEQWRDVSMCVIGAFLFLVFASLLWGTRKVYETSTLSGQPRPDIEVFQRVRRGEQ